MFARKAFRYKQQVQKASGNVVDEVVTCYWSPTAANISTCISDTARVQVIQRSKGDAIAIGKAELVD